MNENPTTHGDNGPISPADGRTPRGTFAKGNRLGRGNPQAGRVAKLRAAMLKAVTADDISAIIGSLIAAARGGDIAAAKEILDRTIGRPPVGLTFGLNDRDVDAEIESLMITLKTSPNE